MIIRPRRLRKTRTLREMVKETSLSVKDFINPLFVKHGHGMKDPISSMPDQYQFSVDTVSKEAADIWSLGIPSVIVFVLPDKKESTGSRSYAADVEVHSA